MDNVFTERLRRTAQHEEVCLKHHQMMVAVALSMGIWSTGSPATAAKQNYLEVLQDIAQDIESLKGEFPQLKDFWSAKAIDPERLVIDYAYRTHRAERRGGWTSGVPNPDDDGVWFYIDFHEPDSRAQIHTQPVTLRMYLGDKRVSFLILEGKKTKPLADRISTVLKKHGVTMDAIKLSSSSEHTLDPVR